MASGDSGSLSPEEVSRQQAEARRQKILNRGKERLTRITGGAPSSEPDGASQAAAISGSVSSASAQVQSAADASTTPKLLPSQQQTPAPSAPSDITSAALSSEDAQAMQAMQQLMQQMIHSGLMGSDSNDGSSRGVNLGSPAFPTLPQTTDSPTPLRDPAQSTPTPGGGGSLGAFSFAPAPAPATSTTRATAGGSSRSVGLPAGAPAAPSAAVAVFGPELQAAVQHTVSIRCLAAVLLAACLIYGVVDAATLRLPPMLLLVATQVTLILGAKTLSRRGMYQAYLPTPLPEEAIPLKMRSIDLAAFIPGLRPALTAMQALLTLSSSLSAGVCMFLVTYSLLQASMRPIS